MPAAVHIEPTTGFETPQFPSPRPPEKAKRKMKLSPRELTSVEKGNHLMKEALKDKLPEDATYLWRLMKKNEVVPNLETYKLLLAAFSMSALGDEPLNVINELEENDITPDQEIYNALLRCMATAKQTSNFSVATVQQYGARYGLQPDAESRQLLVLAFLKAYDFRRAWREVEHMKALGIKPRSEIFSALLGSNMIRALPQSTIQVAEEMIRQGVPLLASDIHRVLEICLRNEQLDNTHKFIQLLETNRIPITEAHMMPVLLFAGRRASPEFTMKVIEMCKQLKYARNLVHTQYEALARSQAYAFQFSEVYKTIIEMQKHALLLRPHARKAVVDAMSRNLKVIDEVYGFAEELYTSKKEEVDSNALLSLLNLVISACSQTHQLSKAFSMFAALDSFALQPDIHSFHALLEGVSVVPGHLATVTQIYEQILKHELQPTDKTFHHLISAFLVNNELEKGMATLDAAHSQNVSVDYDTYAMLVRKMWRVNNPELLARVQEAMVARGLMLDEKLQAYLRTPPNIPVNPSEVPRLWH